MLAGTVFDSEWNQGADPKRAGTQWSAGLGPKEKRLHPEAEPHFGESF